jgi:hypothetical protein
MTEPMALDFLGELPSPGNFIVQLKSDGGVVSELSTSVRLSDKKDSPHTSRATMNARLRVRSRG